MSIANSEVDAAPRVPKIPKFLRSPMGIVGLSILIAWIIATLAAPWIIPTDPLAQSFDRLQAPSGENWFGTDAVGRDVFTRVLYGARTSILLAFLVVIGSMIIGTILGAIAGYIGGKLDEVIMRITDLVFSFPSIILAMIIAAALGPSLLNAFIALLIVSWPSFARVTRSLVIVIVRSEYVIGGRLLGVSSLRSLRRDVLPNMISQIFVLATLDIGRAILELAGLSFLGLGAVPPTPDWGGMISAGVHNFSAWWIALFPGLAILTVVVASNLIGDALRDSLDPSTVTALKGNAK